MRRKVSFLLPFLFVTNVSFAGIPTIDPAAIAAFTREAIVNGNRFIETMNQYKQQLTEAQNIKNKLEEEARATAERLVGNLKLNIPDPTAVAFLTKNWTQLKTASEVKKILENNNDYKNNQKNIQNLTKASDFIFEVQKSNEARNKRITALFQKLQTVKNPSEKQDLNNALQAEMLQLEVNKMQIETHQKMMAQEQTINNQIALQNFKQKHFGK